MTFSLIFIKKPIKQCIQSKEIINNNTISMIVISNYILNNNNSIS